MTTLSLNDVQITIHNSTLTERATDIDEEVCDTGPCPGCLFAATCATGFACKNFMSWRSTGKNPSLDGPKNCYPRKFKCL